MYTRTNIMNMLCFLLLLMASSCAFAQSYRIDWNSMNSCGGIMSSASYKISGSIGQSAADYTESTNFMHWVGFWVPEMTVSGGYILSSTVHLGDYTGTITGIPVTLDLLIENGSTILRTVNTALDAAGKFYIHDVEPGRYKVGIKPSHWLRNVTDPVEVIDSDVGFTIR